MGLKSASVVVITTTDLTGKGVLDLTGRAENITFTAADDKLLAGWGPQDPTAHTFMNGPNAVVNDYAHMIEVLHLGAIGTVLGGSGADTYNIYQTGTGFTTVLDGQGGRDTYDFHNFGHGSSIAAKVIDTGKKWDTGNKIVVDGSPLDDTIVANTLPCGSTCIPVNGTATAADLTTLTDSSQSWTSGQWVGRVVSSVNIYGAFTSLTITANTGTVLTGSGGWSNGTPPGTSAYQIEGEKGQVCSPDCSAPQQIVTYVTPAPDDNAVQLQINGNAGNDAITVAGTIPAVPVQIDGGAGNDVINVGGGQLSGIEGISQPGLNAPLGVGPVVVAGGSGINTLIVDDSSDTVARTGFLTAFLETRTTAPKGVEVGVVSGLGSQLYPDAATFAASGAAGDDRIEFEAIQAVNVKLGQGGNLADESSRSEATVSSGLARASCRPSARSMFCASSTPRRRWSRFPAATEATR